MRNKDMDGAPRLRKKPIAVAYFEYVYPEIIKPALESRRAQLDPACKPVETTLLDAYLERMEVFYRAGATGADERLARAIEELAPWVNPSINISADRAHGGPLGEMMLDAGCDYPKVYETLEKERKRNRGRPVALRAIEALEMKLAGKAYHEIADAFCDYSMAPHKRGQNEPHRHGDVCSERFRKEITELRALYEKYKPRN